MRKLVAATAMFTILLAAAAAYALAAPAPNSNGYHRLYFCADEQGHLTYIENSRRFDCPGLQEILVMIGTEVEQP